MSHGKWIPFDSATRADGSSRAGAATAEDRADVAGRDGRGAARADAEADKGGHRHAAVLDLGVAEPADGRVVALRPEVLVGQLERVPEAHRDLRQRSSGIGGGGERRRRVRWRWRRWRRWGRRRR